MLALATSTTFAIAAAPAADAGTSSQMVGTDSGSLPPAYLLIPNVKDCLGTQSAGTYSTSCIPETMPTACDATSWGKLQADNAGLKACTTTTATTPTTQLPTEAEITQYNTKVRQYMQLYIAEIKQFVAEHKEAIDGVEADIEKAIESGNFDIQNYQTEIKKIVDAHGLEQYHAKFEAFVASHKAELEAFLAAHKGEIDAVQDKIEAAIKSGNFDIQNYQQQIETFVKQYGLEQYEQKLGAFVASPLAELEAFLAAHKGEIDAVQDKIEAAIKSGNFDINNYQQQIETFVKQHGLEQYEQKLGAFVASHKAELEAFLAAHKGEIDAVQDKIEAAIKSGNFDIQNYQQQIEKYQAGDAKKLVDEQSTDAKDDEAKDATTRYLLSGDIEQTTAGMSDEGKKDIAAKAEAVKEAIADLTEAIKSSYETFTDETKKTATDQANKIKEVGATKAEEINKATVTRRLRGLWRDA